MAISYSTLFGDLGVFVKRINEYRGWAVSSLPADLAAILGQLTTSGGTYPSVYAIGGDVPSKIAQYQNTLTGDFCGYMAGKTQQRIMDLQTVINQLALPPNPNLNQVLAALLADMIANSQTVLQCTTTLGSVTAAASNTGNASVMLTSTLDGYSSPASGVQPNRNYAGLASQLTVPSETQFLTCVADQSSGLTEGQEHYAWYGAQPGNGPWDVTEGSGQYAGQVTTLNGSGLVTNGEFENWTVVNVPDGWTIAAGTAGTNVFQDTSTPYRGLSDLKLTGDGSTATITLTQALNMGNLKPLQRFALACYIKGQSGIAAGALTIELVGIGYTAGSSEKISMNAAALAAATSYGLHYFTVLLPAAIPTSMALSLSISITGTLTSAKSVLIDGLGFGPVSWLGGVGAFVSPGSTATLLGDAFSYTVANNAAGVWQSWARRGLRMQLPSVASSPSLADSLAT